jgi:hypothetical protein
MTHEELLNIDALMQGPNQARQLRAHALWSAAKLGRRQGNRELADRLKAAGNRLVHKNFQINNPPEQKLAALTARADSAREILAYAPFRDRGFSDRTINALAAWGIDAPERLLFTPEAELKRIPGIGPASLAEIMRYQARFLPEAAARIEKQKARREKDIARRSCVDCGCDTCPRGQPADWYMVHDQLWASAGMAPDGDCLCVECLENRIGRQLNRTDFTSADVNDPNRPHSARLRNRLQQPKEEIIELRDKVAELANERSISQPILPKKTTSTGLVRHQGHPATRKIRGS